MTKDFCLWVGMGWIVWDGLSGMDCLWCLWKCLCWNATNCRLSTHPFVIHPRVKSQTLPSENPFGSLPPHYTPMRHHTFWLGWWPVLPAAKPSGSLLLPALWAPGSSSPPAVAGSSPEHTGRCPGGDGGWGKVHTTLAAIFFNLISWRIISDFRWKLELNIFFLLYFEGTVTSPFTFEETHSCANTQTLHATRLIS